MTLPERNPQSVFYEEALTLWKQARNREDFLLRLRERGAQKIECIQTLRRIADDEFHDSLIRAAEHIDANEPQRIAS